MRLRFSTLIIACLMGLAGCGGNSDATATALATAGPDTDDLLVHGVVTRGDEPLPRAKVWLGLWPEDDDTEPGEAVDIWSSKPVTTDRDGHYAIRLDPKLLTSKYFDGDLLNFDLNLFNDGKLATWSSTVNLVRHRLWRSDDQGLSGDTVLTMSLDISAPTITTTDSRGDRETSELVVMDVPRGIVPTSAG